MERPTADIEACLAAHERLARIVTDMPDQAISDPSLLPDWTRGHVLTHLARNADSMCRRIHAALRSELAEQYVGGKTGRAAEIEAGAARPARDIAEDTLASAARLEELLTTLNDECWSRPVASVGGENHPLGSLPARRWREVEVHLVDLNVGFTASDWSDAFIQRTLPGLLDRLPHRTDARQLMAWLLGRAAPPTLPPWG